MDTKLTLRLDKNIIDQIKIYAMQQQQSLSSLTEGLYKEILIEKEKDDITTPIAKKYKGILGENEISIDQIKTEYLMEKHLR